MLVFLLLVKKGEKGMMAMVVGKRENEQRKATTKDVVGGEGGKVVGVAIVVGVIDATK